MTNAIVNTHAIYSNANCADNNDSNLIQPKVARVSTMNSNAGMRWWSSLLLLGIVFSALAFSAEAKAYASLTADFCVDGEVVRGTITAERIVMQGNNFAVPTPPWYFTTDGITYGPYWEGGLEVVQPGGIGRNRNNSLSLNNAGYLDFTQTEGYIVSCNGNYTLGIYEATSGKCIHNSNNVGTKSTREIFDSMGTGLLDNKAYTLVYADESGITIYRNFIYTNNQFFGK